MYRTGPPIFNASLRTGMVPTQWLVASLRPLFKLNPAVHRKKTLDPNKYRGITLHETMLKLMEKVVQIRLMTFLASSYNSPCLTQQKHAAHVSIMSSTHRAHDWRCIYVGCLTSPEAR